MRLGGRQHVERLSHLVLKGRPLGADPVGDGLAGEAGIWIDAEQHHQVGPYSTQPRLVHRPHQLDPQSASASLIGERRIDTAVAHHPGSFCQRGPDHLRGELCPLGGEQQRLGPRRHLVLGVQQQVADPLPGPGSPGLTHRHHPATGLPQGTGETVRHRRLAGTLDPFQRQIASGHASSSLERRLPRKEVKASLASRSER